MASPLSEVEFLRSELDKMFKRTLELEFENKSLKRELADNRVFAYVQQKERAEAATVAATVATDEETSAVFSSSSSSVEAETPWFTSSSSAPSAPSVLSPPAAPAATATKEAHRVANERKRLQALWIQHKVRPEKPLTKLLKTLREGLKEAGIPF